MGSGAAGDPEMKSPKTLSGSGLLESGQDGRTRTFNHVIPNHAFCQLNYALKIQGRGFSTAAGVELVTLARMCHSLAHTAMASIRLGVIDFYSDVLLPFLE